MSMEGLIAQYGLTALFIGSGTEGEVAAAAGGFLTHRGILPAWPMAAAVFAGSAVAGQTLFFIGRACRATAWIKRLHARPTYVKVLSALDRWPVSFILGYRFVFGFKTLSPLVMGVSSISVIRFSLLNLLSAALWSAVFIALGYFFGAGVELFFGRMPSLQHLAIGAAVIVLAAVGYWLWARRRTPRG